MSGSALWCGLGVYGTCGGQRGATERAGGPSRAAASTVADRKRCIRDENAVLNHLLPTEHEGWRGAAKKEEWLDGAMSPHPASPPHLGAARRAVVEVRRTHSCHPLLLHASFDPPAGPATESGASALCATRTPRERTARAEPRQRDPHFGAAPAPCVAAAADLRAAAHAVASEEGAWGRAAAPSAAVRAIGSRVVPGSPPRPPTPTSWPRSAERAPSAARPPSRAEPPRPPAPSAPWSSSARVATAAPPLRPRGGASAVAVDQQRPTGAQDAHSAPLPPR